MDMVKLKNGIEEAGPLVAVTMMTLRKLMTDNPIVLIELVAICQDSTHEFWGDSRKQLVDMALIQPDGKPHNSIKNIIVSAIEGEGLDMCIVNPVA